MAFLTLESAESSEIIVTTRGMIKPPYMMARISIAQMKSVLVVIYAFKKVVLVRQFTYPKCMGMFIWPIYYEPHVIYFIGTTVR